MLANDLHDHIVPFALRLADATREVALRHFRGPLRVERKVDASPVTAIDREIEQLARERIAAQFPDHGVRGEELPDTPCSGAFTWVLDPIDGTKSFVTGKPLFGTLIALLEDARPVLGVIDIPVIGERWLGVSGATTLNADKCATSTVTALAEATLYASSPEMFSAVHRPRFEHLSAQTRFRCFGADCYAYGLLSSGYTELVAEADMQPYDYMALVPVVENAGGVITDWNGAALTMESDGTVLAAANPTLHRLALACLRD